MKKRMMITLGVFIVLVLLGFLFFRVELTGKSISGMAVGELGEHTLNQGIVEDVIGNEQVGIKRVDPLKIYSQEDVDRAVAMNSECSGKISVGEEIQTVAFYTSTREINVLWLNDEIACVVVWGR